MKKKVWAIILISLILLSVLPACTRAASKAPTGKATDTGSLPFPLPGTDNPASVFPINTQTPAAANTASSDFPLPAASQPPATLAPTEPPPLPTPTFVTIATATPGLPATYTIHPGEWPFCIARRFNIDPNAMLEANDLEMEDQPDPGTELKIPPGAGPWPGERQRVAHPAIYTVQEGDTVYSIACDFGDVDPNAIIAANNLTEPYDIAAGQVLQVP